MVITLLPFPEIAAFTNFGGNIVCLYQKKYIGLMKWAISTNLNFEKKISGDEDNLFLLSKDLRV